MQNLIYPITETQRVAENLKYISLFHRRNFITKRTSNLNFSVFGKSLLKENQAFSFKPLRRKHTRAVPLHIKAAFRTCSKVPNQCPGLFMHRLRFCKRFLHRNAFLIVKWANAR